MLSLKEIDIFKALSNNSMQKIENSLIIKEYTKSSIVFYEGDSSEYLHIVLSGRVRLYKTTPKGNIVEINRLKEGSLIGEYACFENQPFPATCEFVEDGVMGLIPFDLIYSNLNDANFSLEIIKSLTIKISLLTVLVHKETILSSDAKVADIIIKKPVIFERLKNNEIASILNLSPETFSRIIAKFKKEGVIDYKKHKLTILDYDALHDMVENNKFKDCTNCIVHFKEQIGYKE